MVNYGEIWCTQGFRECRFDQAWRSLNVIFNKIVSTLSQLLFLCIDVVLDLRYVLRFCCTKIDTDYSIGKLPIKYAILENVGKVGATTFERSVSPSLDSCPHVRV